MADSPLIQCRLKPDHARQGAALRYYRKLRNAGYSASDVITDALLSLERSEQRANNEQLVYLTELAERSINMLQQLKSSGVNIMSDEQSNQVDLDSSLLSSLKRATGKTLHIDDIQD
jgi:hypothetical protein